MCSGIATHVWDEAVQASLELVRHLNGDGRRYRKDHTLRRLPCVPSFRLHK